MVYIRKYYRQVPYCQVIRVIHIVIRARNHIHLNRRGNPLVSLRTHVEEHAGILAQAALVDSAQHHTRSLADSKCGRHRKTRVCVKPVDIVVPVVEKDVASPGLRAVKTVQNLLNREFVVFSGADYVRRFL